MEIGGPVDRIDVTIRGAPGFLGDGAGWAILGSNQ
jgi:hypothetical protein